MAWRIEFDQVALDNLRRIDKEMQRRIVRYLKERIALSDNPRQWGKPLHGNRQGLWRYRVGNYRVLCQLLDVHLTILVVEIGHRSRVYQGL